VCVSLYKMALVLYVYSVQNGDSSMCVSLYKMAIVLCVSLCTK